MSAKKEQVDPRTERRVRDGLEASYVSARETRNELSVELEAARFAIFSDQHRGVRDGADDFRRCEEAYGAALQHYFDGGYTLIVLGDAEELWECRPRPVVDSYRNSLLREAAFHERQRYIKISGNHDDYWETPSRVQELLGPLFGPSIAVRKNIRLLFHRGQQQVGELFLVHGHQGDYISDRAGKIARLFVRYVWRPIQRITRISLDTPASDYQLRGEQNIAMYRWAKKKKGLVLIAGHTHEPVFESQNHLARLEANLAGAQAAGDGGRAAEVTAELARRRTVAGAEGRRSFSGARPCYFNTGCCSFKDGDITGIEIADGIIRLVRWPDDEGLPRAKVLQESRMLDVFDAVNT